MKDPIMDPRRGKKFVGLKLLALTMLVLISLLLPFGINNAQALDQSENVVVIGGSTLDLNNPCQGNISTDANTMYWTGGGCLPVVGPLGELGDFSFTAMSPADVSAATLAPFDTAVLNVASSAMQCDTNTLTEQQQADLIAFVEAGNKLIIYDSECYPGPVDYSWLPFPFTTANPGAMGAQGTLTIVEENTLSSADSTSPYFIDAADLGNNTDAVGDMNVMTTFDPNWFIDMSGTNILGVTGPVHTYANFPAGTDIGLIIYNGLDQDYQYSFAGNPNLRKIWVQELQQEFNPAELPSSVTVIGILLTPPSATNAVGDEHTVTASLTDMIGTPQPGVLVTFSILSGPNAGASGTCSPNADCTSDANGEVSFTYIGSGGEGTDEIQACFTNDQGENLCDTATKEWEIINEPPDCSDAQPTVACIWPPNHKFVDVGIIGVTDPDGDPVTIEITGVTSDEATATTLGAGGATHAPDATGVGSDTASVRAERSGLGDGRVFEISFTADDGLGGICSGSVQVAVPHDVRKGSCSAVDSGQTFDATQ